MTHAVPAVAPCTVLVEVDGTKVAWVSSRREFFALSPAAALLVDAITTREADGPVDPFTAGRATDTDQELVHQLQGIGVLTATHDGLTATDSATSTQAVEATTGTRGVERSGTSTDDGLHSAGAAKGPTLGPYAALAHHFVIEVDGTVSRHPGRSLVAELRRVLANLVTDEPAAEPARYRIVTAPKGPAVYRDGQCLDAPASPAGVLATVLWDLNRRAVAATPDCLVLHAGAVVDDRGRAVVMPAAMEAGKTTLVTALVRAGFDYLSDELVAVPEPGGTVLAYPKALSIDRGSWRLFPELVPAAEQLDLSPDQWLVTADQVRDGAVHPGPGNPAVLVLPRHRAGSPTELEPLRPLETLRDLAACAFGLGERPEHVLPRVAHLAEAVPSFRLTVGDGTEAAVAAVRTALSRIPPRTGRFER